MVAPGGITLPDVLTESDLFMNLDASLLLPPALNLEPEGKQPTPLDFGTQLLPDSSFRRSVSQEPARLEDHTLVDLDLGEDEMPLGHDMSIEAGRDAPAPRPVEEDLFSDSGKFNDVDLPLDLGEDEAPLGRMDVDEPDDGPGPVDLGNDFQEDTTMDVGRNVEEGEEREAQDNALPDLERETESPLSEVRSENFRDLEDGVTGDYDEGPSVVVVQQQQEEQPHRSKRRRVLGLDDTIMLHSHQIKEQQADRSSILKPTSFLPRDPVLLTLMSMQKNGDFVNSVMGEGRGSGWAPELRDLLSFDSVKKSGELKRKRDSGVADLDVQAGAAAAAAAEPALELGEEEGIVPADEGIDVDTSLNQQKEVELPGEKAGEHTTEAETGGEEMVRGASEDEGMAPELDVGGFDDTADIAVGGGVEDSVPTADSGAVSAGTKHAVQILREQLGGQSATQQKKSGVLFQDMMPEKKTSRVDATQMFFEVLALATKDVVKVEQATETIGGPLKIRGKQGLWGGTWMEEESSS